MEEFIDDFERRLSQLIPTTVKRPMWQPTELGEFMRNLNAHRASSHRLKFLRSVSSLLHNYSFEIHSASTSSSASSSFDANLTDPSSPPHIIPPPSPAFGLRPPSPASPTPLDTTSSSSYSSFSSSSSSSSSSFSSFSSFDPSFSTSALQSSSSSLDDVEWLSASVCSPWGAVTADAVRFHSLLQGQSDARLVEEAVLLFVAVLPASFKLDSVPSMALLFRNDCDFLAHQLVALASPPGALLHAALLLRRLARRHLALHRDMLLRGLLRIMSREDEDQPSEPLPRDSAVLDRLLCELQRGVALLRSLLPIPLQQDTVAMLLEGILGPVVAHIVALEEISEAETVALGGLLQRFDACIPLLDERTLRRGVPSWTRLCKLRRILASSLVEIMDAYHSGDLEEFNAAELRQMITALFVETPLRSRHLKTILDE